MNLEELSNNELKLKIKVLTDEFEALKLEVSNKVKHLEELSTEFNKCNEILNNRLNSRIK
jgi:hypothetical protein